MKTVIKIVAISFLCIMAFGCKDSFLNLAPISNSNADNFYKTRADFDVAVNAAYATLYVMYGPESNSSYCGEQLSDNCTVYSVSAFGTVNIPDRQAYKDYNVQPTNTVNYAMWQQDYNSLYDINIVLSKIEGTSLDATYKEEVKAEMMFLRALYYFTMVQTWGDIPLVTTPITAGNSYSVLRSPAADVYNQIISDLQYAIARLPLANAVSAPGRASKGAAQTLLGKVYLTMGNKTSAASVLTEVYNSSQYGLLTNYSDLWSITNKNTKESIFEVQFKGGTSTGPNSLYYDDFAPYQNAGGLTFGGGMNQVTDNLYNEYESGDKRRNLSIDTGYYVGTSYVYIKFPKKWVDNTVTKSALYCHNNFIVLRYADLLLMLSEATGDAQYLNQVRGRVGLPLYGSAGYPAKYSTLDLAIEHERRVELALEFNRWFDLKRTGRAVAVLLANKGKTITTQKLVMPIPLTYIQENPAITQNDGY
ncbi:MAG: RagB/SusD family nutrient uptake outer membrane protein [Bacteroidales bacterium]